MKKCLLFILTFIVSVGSSWATFVPKVSNDQFRYYYSFTVQSSRAYKVLYDKQDGNFTGDGSNSKSVIKAHFRFEQGTGEGRYYLASRLTGRYWYVGSYTNEASITLIDDKRSATEWVVVDLGGNMSLKPADATEDLYMYHNTFDDKSNMKFILSNKTNDSHAKWAAELQCQEIKDFTTSDGEGNYTVNATGDSFGISSQMNGIIQSGNVTFTGSGDNGVAIDMDNNDVPISGHWVFKNGIHTFRKLNQNGKTIKFGTNATAENPTIYIKEGARLTATLKNPCGWNRMADVDGIIRIDGTSMLEIKTEGENTAYYSQRLYMEPGAQIVINSSAGDMFRMNGGVNEATAQLYMPASSEGSAVAEISAYNNGNIFLPDNNTKDVAVYVGSNSILKISAPIKGHTKSKPHTIQKYGEGTLYITGVQTDVSYVVSLGTLRTNVNLGQQVTINTGAVLEIEGGSDETTPLVFDMPTTNNGSNVIKSGFVKIAAGTEGTMKVASGATLMLQLTAQQVTEGYDASAITGTGTIMFVDESGNLINIIRKATTIGKFGTICLPYAATVSDAKVYTVSVNVESNTVVLTEFTGSILNGGTPYIYSSTAGAPTFTKLGTDALLSSPSNPESGLVGTFTSLPAPVGSYVLQTISGAQKFRVVADGQQPTVGAYRCYIKTTTNSAREMSIELGEATGIDALNAIVNNNAEVYDLAGRKMNGLHKGINIVNGAKIIVK